MTSGVELEWIDVIRRWAEGEPLIEAVYLFGSRVKDTHHPQSDLDVAVIVAGQDDGERLGNAICEQVRWVAELQQHLPLKLHLQSAMDDNTVVMPAIREHGIIIFDRIRP